MSARNTNFGIAQRERERKIARGLEDPYDTTTQGGDPASDAFFGSLYELGQRANQAGMGFRANLGDIGRFDEPTTGGGRLTATDRAGIAGNVALGRYADESGANQMARDAYGAQRQQQIIDELKASDRERQVAQAYATPERASVTTETIGPTGKPEAYSIRPVGQESERDRILAMLPAPLRPVQQAQWAAQDAANLKAQTELTKAQTEATKARTADAAATPFSARTDATGKPLTGPAALEGVPESVRATVQAVLDGRQALPTGTATKDPYWKGIIQLANQADPNFDAVDYNARAKTRSDFTSGKAAGQINAINTAVGHLHQLAGEGEKLGNFGMNWVNSIYNMLTPGGSERGVTLNNFNTLKEGVGTELMRVWRQVGAGSEKEIEEWKSTIKDAKSPEELRGAFKTIGGMLESKLDSLDNQYKQGMGTDKVSAISPESRQMLDALQGMKSAPAKAAAPSAATGGGAPAPSANPFRKK